MGDDSGRVILDELPPLVRAHLAAAVQDHVARLRDEGRRNGTDLPGWLLGELAPFTRLPGPPPEPETREQRARRLAAVRSARYRARKAASVTHRARSGSHTVTRIAS